MAALSNGPKVHVDTDAADAMRYAMARNMAAGKEKFDERRHMERILEQLERSRNDGGAEHQREMMRRMLEQHSGQNWREEKIDPNSAEGIMQLERAAMQQGLSRPFKLCMTSRTWSDFIDSEAKEYITQQMDAGELIVEISNEGPDRTILLTENT